MRTNIFLNSLMIQKKVSLAEKDLQLAIIARRSLHFAGRRFVEKGSKLLVQFIR